MDVGTITRALESAIVADGDFQGVLVEREEFVNEDTDAARVGWIGIYRRGVTYNPLTLAAGYAGRYDLSPLKLLVIIQTCDYVSGEACADRLETHIKNFIDLLLANDSISNTVERISRLDIEYGYEPKSKKGEVYMQSAFITLDLETANE